MAFGYEDELKAEIARLRDALDEQTGRAAWHYECLTQCEEEVIQRDAEIERLRLTHAEREAIEWCAAHARLTIGVGRSATLRGLLERTGDCPTPDNAADRNNGTTGSVFRSLM
jgi:hypothetical protein